jgi:tetratricopeptide (TPR) repeat protein
MEKKEQAGLAYRQGIDLYPSDSENAAWSYLGLSNLYPFQSARRLPLLEQARNAFLLSGNLGAYVRTNLKIVLYYQHFDIKNPKAMSLLNEVIEIIEVSKAKKENRMNEEYISAMRMKAELLHSYQEDENALECIDKALEGYANSFGNEADLIHFATLGQIIARESGNEVAELLYQEVGSPRRTPAPMPARRARAPSCATASGS